jgi:hypothetical protein
LPNQFVALQSLLQLLSLEESARLSEAGREYVRRLQGASLRAGDMVRFLKEMGRLNVFVPRRETITLATMARELQGELQRLHPNRQFAFEWRWGVTTMTGDSRACLQAIVELASGVVSNAEQRCRFTADSSADAEQFVLNFLVADDSGAMERLRPDAMPVPPQVIAERMEVILARAWLTMSNAALKVTAFNPSEIAFSIIVPRR